MGGLVGLATWCAGFIFPPFISGLIGCVCWVAVTGGLHLDGVADCGDALPVEVSPERRLEIMKDSRLGTFGGTALFFNLALKIAALTTLAQTCSMPLMIIACTLAGLLARAQIFFGMRFPSARPGGMGDAFRQGTCPMHAVIALLVVIGACGGAAYWVGWHAMYAFDTAVLVSLLLLWYAKRRLGGVTGDVFGCTVECTEWAVLLSFCTAV